jgi:hypothetical protein
MIGAKLFGSGLTGLAVQALCQDVGTSLTATGTTQATALELVNADNDVTSVSSGAGVKLLSTASAGDMLSVFNSGANPLKVYPDLASQINSLPVNIPMALSPSTGCVFKRVSTTKWFGVLSA